VEGFVNTAAKIHWSFISGLFGKEGELSLAGMIRNMFMPWGKKSQEAMKAAGFSVEQNMNARRMALSAYLIGFLLILKAITASGGGDGDDDDDENQTVLDPTTGLVHYFAMRTLLEQQALIYLPEIFIQGGQLFDLVPVGASALYDIGKLVYEGVGAVVGDKDDKDFFYQRDDVNGRYEEGDSKFWVHFKRITPYWKSWWGLLHPYEAAKNYEFGRKLRTR
jgi:hypothetical protein